MSAFVNDRDIFLEAQGNLNLDPRKGRDLFITVDPVAFHVDAQGIATPTFATFTAHLIGMPNGVVSWSVSAGGALDGDTPNVRTQTFAKMTATSVKATATIVFEGETYSDSRTLSKMADGVDGIDGIDGIDSPPQTAAQLKDTLVGQLTANQFVLDLQNRIGLIDSAASVAGSVNARLKAESDARVADIGGEVTNRGAAISAAMAAEVAARNAYVANYTYTKEASDSSLAQQATNITAAYKTYTDTKTGQVLTDAQAYVRGYSYSIADANSAIATSASNLQANIASAISTSKAYTETWGYSKAQIDTAETAQYNALTTALQGYANGVGNAATSTAAADVRSYGYSKSEVTGAIAASSTALTTSYTGAIDAAKTAAMNAAAADVRSYTTSSSNITAAIASSATNLTTSFQTADASNLTAAKSYADSAITNYGYSKADTTSAIATSTNTVTARLNNIGGATLEQTFTAQASAITGLGAKWAIKLDVNGSIAGITLASGEGSGTSTFAVTADKFALTYPGVASKIPFIVGKVAGQSVIGFDGSVVIDGSLTLRAPDGTIIISAGGLRPGFEAPGTKNADLPPVVSNMIPSNSLPSSLGKFTANSSLGPSAWAGPFFGSPLYSPHNLGSIYVYANGTPDPGLSIDTYLNVLWEDRIPVVGNTRYEVSAAMSAHRCVGRIVAVWYDANANYIGEASGSALSEGFSYDYYPGDLFPRSTAFFTVPANAARVMILSRMYTNGGNNPYVFASEFYMGRAAATQTVGTKYTDFSANGLAASIAANKQTADAAIARVNADADRNVLSRGEKGDALKDWRVIDAEQPVLAARANSLGVNHTAYDSAYAALIGYLGTIGSNGSDWWNTGFDNVIDGDTYNAAWTTYYTAKMVLQNDFDAKAATTSTWDGVSGAGKPDSGATVGAPAGTLVAGVSAALVATATTNFNTSNDRNATAIVAPTILADGTAVDHVIRTDGAADISFEWAWSGAEGDIDGFLVYVYQSSSSGAYTFGTTPAAETVYTVPASKRAFIQFGAAANTYTTFGVQAYRSVDKDIAASGAIKSTLVKPGLAAENPYRPSASVAFVGDVTGTINGTAAATLLANVTTAQQDAAAAKAIADAQAADGILDRGEKSLLKGQWADIVAEYPRLIASAEALGIGAEKTNYTAAYSALASYLNGIGPGGTGGWSNTDVNSTIDRAVHIAKFGDYADKKMVLSSVLARVAATTATAAGLTGQLTVAAVPNFIPPNGVTDALFGGNLKSSNWNGDTGVNGMGFLLERATGFIYCGGLKARGAVMGGAFTSYAWPTSGAGFYAGPEGFKCGTVASNRYFNADQFGDIYSPGFTSINSQVTVTDAILVRPRIGDNMVASISGGGYFQVATNTQFTDLFVGTYTASITNSSGNLGYSWNSTNASGFTTRVVGTGSQVQVYATGKVLQGQELDFYVNCTITDLSSSVSRPAQANSQIAANS
jgi:hypothetical protein